MIFAVNPQSMAVTGDVNLELVCAIEKTSPQSIAVTGDVNAVVGLCNGKKSPQLSKPAMQTR